MWEVNGKKCNNCGYVRQESEIKRRHRCPQCNEPYFLTRLLPEKHEWRPNQIPQSKRILYATFSIILFAYGTAGVKNDDIFIPDRKNIHGIHIHGMPAWIMYGAIISACIVMLSVVIDHYDKRNNEHWYKFGARLGNYIGWSLFGASIAFSIFSNRLTPDSILGVFPAIAFVMVIWSSADNLPNEHTELVINRPIYQQLLLFVALPIFIVIAFIYLVTISRG